MKFLIRLSLGSDAPLDETVEVREDSLSIGFAKDCNLVIDDAGVLDHHARIFHEDGGFWVEALGAADLVVNQSGARRHRLRFGDVIQIGGKALHVLENPGHEEFHAELREMTRSPVAGVTGKFLRWSPNGQYFAHFRVLAWVALALAFLFLMVMPLASLEFPSLDRLMNRGGTFTRLMTADSWSVGPVSRYHIRIANDCETCHSDGAFTNVPDKACESCHDQIKHHFNINKVDHVETPVPLCGDCHQEHIADNFLVLGDRVEQCLLCHGDIKSTYRQTDLRDIPKAFGNESFFGGQHPQFKASIVNKTSNAEASVDRVLMSDTARLFEKSGLRKFSHRDHMEKNGVLAPDGLGGADLVKLECWSCHKSDPKDGHMSTASFDENCHGCHKLTFDELSPHAELPHGKAEDVLGFLKNFYAQSPKGTLIAVPEDSKKSERSLPGKMISRGSPDFAVGSYNLDGFSKEMGQRIFDNGVCSECHTVQKPTAEFETWTIVKPQITARWFPKAKFSHGAHEIYECGGCHSAEASETPGDVNIPGQENCVECHSSDNSSCLKCHTFHSESHFKLDGSPLLPKKEMTKPWHGHATADDHGEDGRTQEAKPK